MPSSLFITGTDTGVGKTVAAAALIMLYHKAGINTGFMKPVQSGAAVDENNNLFSQDAAFLAQAAGRPVTKDNSPYVYGDEISPYLAAARSGEAIGIDLIAAAFERLRTGCERVIVEGAGGILAPLTADQSMADLVAELDLPLVVTVRAGLGTLNHSHLTVEAARRRGLEVLGLVVNGFPAKPDLAASTNIEELERVTGAPVLMVIPDFDNQTVDAGEDGHIARFLKTIDAESVLFNLTPKPAATDRLVSDDLKYVWHPFTQQKEYECEEPRPPVIAKAKGSYLYDTEGKRYLDGVSSLWVNIHGHRHPTLDKALIDQTAKVAHSTLLGLANIPSIELARRLAAITPPGLEKVFYSDAGSTAVEAALKIAYQYWRQRGERREKFVSFVNAYHGDTVGAVSVGGIDLFHDKFGPMLFDSIRVEAAYCYRCTLKRSYPGCELACLDMLEAVLAERGDEIAALIIEPKVQGAAGMLVSPPGYLRRVRELTKKYNTLMIADEVATGFGRTGSMFACELEEVAPDIICLAKGITGGYLPLAATITTTEIHSAFYDDYAKLKTFFHGHTYTGNPLACSTALASLDLFETGHVLEKLDAGIGRFSNMLREIEAMDSVGDVRRCGLMAGIELVRDRVSGEPFNADDRVGKRVILKARERGVIIRPLGDVIVLMPPLSISDSELNDLLSTTHWAIEAVTGDN